MHHQLLDSRSHDEITALFTATFTVSEGKDEGRLIGDLASVWLRVLMMVRLSVLAATKMIYWWRVCF